jgi:hypothetical protein
VQLAWQANRLQPAGFVRCDPTLDQFSALLRSGKPVSPDKFASMIGGFADPAMRPVLVVVFAPALQLFASIVQREEPVGVESA